MFNIVSYLVMRWGIQSFPLQGSFNVGTAAINIICSLPASHRHAPNWPWPYPSLTVGWVGWCSKLGCRPMCCYRVGPVLPPCSPFCPVWPLAPGGTRCLQKLRCSCFGAPGWFGTSQSFPGSRPVSVRNSFIFQLSACPMYPPPPPCLANTKVQN